MYPLLHVWAIHQRSTGCLESIVSIEPFQKITSQLSPQMIGAIDLLTSTHLFTFRPYGCDHQSSPNKLHLRKTSKGTAPIVQLAKV